MRVRKLLRARAQPGPEVAPSVRRVCVSTGARPQQRAPRGPARRLRVAAGGRQAQRARAAVAGPGDQRAHGVAGAALLSRAPAAAAARPPAAVAGGGARRRRARGRRAGRRIVGGVWLSRRRCRPLRRSATDRGSGRVARRSGRHTAVRAALRGRRARRRRGRRLARPARLPPGLQALRAHEPQTDSHHTVRLQARRRRRRRAPRRPRGPPAPGADGQRLARGECGAPGVQCGTRICVPAPLG